MAEINGINVPFIPISNNENFGKPQIDKSGKQL